MYDITWAGASLLRLCKCLLRAMVSNCNINIWCHKTLSMCQQRCVRMSENEKKCSSLMFIAHVFIIVLNSGGNRCVRQTKLLYSCVWMIYFFPREMIKIRSVFGLNQLVYRFDVIVLLVFSLYYVNIYSKHRKPFLAANLGFKFAGSSMNPYLKIWLL